MSKIFSEQPISLEKPEQAKALLEIYSNLQPIIFTCTKCKSKSIRKLGNVAAAKYSCLCRACSLKQGFIDKYGVDNPSKLDSVRRKISSTHRNFSTEKKADIRKRTEETCERVYGGKAPLTNSKVKEKAKATLKGRYGVENPDFIADHVDKVRSTWRKKSKEQLKEIVSKRANTCSKIYGEDISNPSQLSLVNKKVKETWANKTDKELQEWRRKSSFRYCYESEYFDSSWELAFWIYCKDMKKHILREPKALSYEVNGQKHRYFPDFEVDERLYEIKGGHLMNNEGVWVYPFQKTETETTEILKAKYECAIRNDVQIIDAVKIQKYLKYVKDTYGKDYLKQFKA